MGLSLYEFNSMTLSEFYYKQEGFNRGIKRNWEQTKLIAYMIHLSTPLKNHLSYDRFLSMDEKGGLSEGFLKRYWEKKKQLQEQEKQKLEQDPNHKWR